ncbi:MAG TPA: hypothetical protein ENI31_03620 [Candidatus Omnitrophica bacterium]|nr:hypothetical protein [Candidatus Omnitrophota bacterium]
MARKDFIIKEKNFHSDKISTQIRAVAIGLLIIIWGILIEKAKPISVALKKHLLAIALIALLVMFLDFLQYLFGYANNTALLHQMDKEKKDEIQYDYSDWCYKGQRCCFWSKIIITFIAFFTLLLWQFSY